MGNCVAKSQPKKDLKSQNYLSKERIDYKDSLFESCKKVQDELCTCLDAHEKEYIMSLYKSVIATPTNSIDYKSYKELYMRTAMALITKYLESLDVEAFTHKIGYDNISDFVAILSQNEENMRIVLDQKVQPTQFATIQKEEGLTNSGGLAHIFDNIGKSEYEDARENLLKILNDKNLIQIMMLVNKWPALAKECTNEGVPLIIHCYKSKQEKSLAFLFSRTSEKEAADKQGHNLLHYLETDERTDLINCLWKKKSTMKLKKGRSSEA